MKILQANAFFVEEIIAVHALQKHAVIAAAVHMNVADGLWIVQRSRNVDRIVDIPRNRLFGRDDRRKVFRTDTDRIDAEIDFLLPCETDTAIDIPTLYTILHQ